MASTLGVRELGLGLGIGLGLRSGSGLELGSDLRDCGKSTG